jgi:hypothetical protein
LPQVELEFIAVKQIQDWRKLQPYAQYELYGKSGREEL